MPAARSTGTHIPHLPPPIVRATDLGGVTVLKSGRQFLLTDELGDVRPDSHGLGLYDGDTRVLSSLQLRVDGHRPAVLRPDSGTSRGGMILLTNRGRRRDEHLGGMANVLGRHAIGVIRRRRLEDGLHEEIEVVNYTDRAGRIRLELLVDADMADIFEVQGHVRPARGRYEPIVIGDGKATFGYRGLDGRRWQTRLDAPDADLAAGSPRRGGGVVARWVVQLAAGDRASVRWVVRGGVAPVRAAPLKRRPVDGPGVGLVEPTSIDVDDPLLQRVLDRGVADLDLLMTPGPGPGERHLAAGIPWFATLFGRDAILASYAALLVDPGPAIATLRVLARLQADADDPARDAEPGKIPHEIRDGEMARLGEVPFGRYYGASDTTPLWIVLLGEVVDWTGDLGLATELWPTVLRALAWLTDSGDPDGDGFVEYARRAPGGLVNQGWKDALDAIRDRNGVVAGGPIALAEVQGYAYDARRRAARLARALGEPDRAAGLEVSAARLKERFDAAFWIPDRRHLAIALDGTKARMDALASNQGHALWSGIVDPSRAADIGAHLGGPALASGWGLRTYATGQPGYSPLGYHTGAVWPHDTAIAIAGLRRYGQDGPAAHLAEQLFAAGRRLPGGRLPELVCGFDAGWVADPVPYPVACAPQAWAAAAPLLVLRALLGLRPEALAGRLILDHPTLPAGVDRLRLDGLRIGAARLDLEARRRRGGVTVEVSGQPSLEVVVIP